MNTISCSLVLTICPHSSTGDTQLNTLLHDHLPLILDFCQTSNLPISLYLSGTALEQLVSKPLPLQKQLITLHEAKLLELLAGFLYDSDPTITRPMDLALQLATARHLQKRLNFPWSSIAFDKAGTASIKKINALYQADITKYILPSDCVTGLFPVTSTFSTIQTGTDSKDCIRIFPAITSHLLLSNLDNKKSTEINYDSLLRSLPVVAYIDVGSSIPCDPKTIIQTLSTFKTLNEITNSFTLTDINTLINAEEKSDNFTHLDENKDYIFKTSNNSTSLVLEATTPKQRGIFASPDSHMHKRLSRALADDLSKTFVPTIHSHAEFLENPRHCSAVRNYCHTLSSEFYTCTSPHPHTDIQQIKRYYNALLRAQVDIDTAVHLNIDPNLGWIYFKSLDSDSKNSEILVIDSQLMRFHFLPNFNGAIATHLYKPRKLNLIPPISITGSNLSGSLALVQKSKAYTAEESLQNVNSLHKTKFQVTRQNPGLLRLHTQRDLCIPKTNPKTNKEYCIAYSDYQFHAGIGAHLKNSTTGFQLEYWTEGHINKPESLLLQLDWFFLPPSLNADGSTLTPLQCVGAVSPTGYSLNNQTTIESSEVSGGIYGARLTDGLEGLVIDFRTSKPLVAITSKPLFSPSPSPSPSPAQSQEHKNDYVGSKLSFYIDLTKVLNSTTPNTIFISIA